MFARNWRGKTLQVKHMLKVWTLKVYFERTIISQKVIKGSKYMTLK